MDISENIKQITYKKLLLSLFFISIICVFTLPMNVVYAASTVMEVNPQTGSYGGPFSVSVVIDGHGDIFNAARATVALSKNLSIKDLELGDCNFSFMKTPSDADPSFEGGILAKSSKKCTVYTMTLLPIGKGEASISLRNATVRHYGDASEVLSSVQNGTYSITGTVTVPKQSQAVVIPTPANGLYSIFLKVLESDSSPARNVSIALNTADGKTALSQMTKTDGTVLFSNVKLGAYGLTATRGNKQVASMLLNVTGKNHVLQLSINLKTMLQSNPLIASQTQKNNPYLIPAVIAVSVVAGMLIALLPRLFKRSKKS